MDEMRLNVILATLESQRQAATYGAVAGLVGAKPHTVMARRERHPGNSWVVNQKTRQPTGYTRRQIHRDLLRSIKERGILDTPEVLAQWLKQLADRLFPIEDAGSDFRAGHDADGTQVLMGLWCGRVVACFFSPQGDFLRYEERPTTTPVSLAASETVAEAWWKEIGFQPGRIAVKEFYYAPQALAVHDGLGQFNYDELDDFERTRAEFAEVCWRRQGWLDDGLFLLFWDRDYYMSPEGWVHTT